MPSCVPGSLPTPWPLCRDRRCGCRVPGAPRDAPPLSPCHPGMASLIVVTEYDTTGSASEEEEMNAPRGEGFGDGREPRAKLHLSGRKLSLQERSQPARSPGSGNGTNERFIYPSLPYSPVTSPHSSPRLPRRPTVESNRVSITGLQVRGDKCCSCGSPAPVLLGFPSPCGISSYLVSQDKTLRHVRRCGVGGGGMSWSILGCGTALGEVGASGSLRFVPFVDAASSHGCISGEPSACCDFLFLSLKNKKKKGETH